MTGVYRGPIHWQQRIDGYPSREPQVQHQCKYTSNRIGKRNGPKTKRKDSSDTRILQHRSKNRFAHSLYLASIINKWSPGLPKRGIVKQEASSKDEVSIKKECDEWTSIHRHLNANAPDFDGKQRAAKSFQSFQASNYLLRQRHWHPRTLKL